MNNDFPISSLAGLPTPYEAIAAVPALAYSQADAAFLVVWKGRDPDLATEEHEIFGRLVEHDGGWLSPRMRLSDVGGTGDSQYTAVHPGLAYAEGHGDFLAVWQANDVDQDLSGFENEIFGQRIGGRLFADGFESGDFLAWTGSFP